MPHAFGSLRNIISTSWAVAFTSSVGLTVFRVLTGLRPWSPRPRLSSSRFHHTSENFDKFTVKFLFNKYYLSLHSSLRGFPLSSLLPDSPAPRYSLRSPRNLSLLRRSYSSSLSAIVKFSDLGQKTKWDCQEFSFQFVHIKLFDNQLTHEQDGRCLTYCHKPFYRQVRI